MTRDEANIITQLVQQVSGLNGRFDAIELARTEARKQDDHWRDRMEQKTDRLYKRVDELAACFNEVPCLIEDRIAACREDRESVTADAVADSRERRSLAKVAADWRTWVAFALAVIAFLVGRG